MKLVQIALIAACLVSGYASAQAQRTEQEDQAVARACKDDAQHMCTGKTGEALQQCLKANQAKLSSNCKQAVSKLPPK
jgi:hypothetical protein